MRTTKALAIIGTLVSLSNSASGQLAITIDGTSGSRDATISFGGTGSWTTAENSSSAFAFNNVNVANSGHSSLENDHRELIQDPNVNNGPGTGLLNAAVDGAFPNGQYVPLTTPIAMTANQGIANLNIVGLLLEGSGFFSEFGLVTSIADDEQWDNGTQFSYTINSSSTFSLDSGIGATFDQAFNDGTYNFDRGLEGSLTITTTAAVPEPGEYAMIAVGSLLGFAFWRRNRAAQVAAC